jgi:hypothetical protein
MSSLSHDDDNPFRAPEAKIGNLAIDPIEPFFGGQAEAIRREHINHEASVKALGTLSYIGSALMALPTIGLLMMGSGLIRMPETNPAGNPGELPPQFMRWLFLGMGVVYLGLTLLGGSLGYGLRALQVWARWTELVLTVLGLLYLLLVIVVVTIVNPTVGSVVLLLGPLIPGYIIYLMVSPKGSMVFSAEYKEVIRQTPSVRPQTSLLTRIVLVIILGLFVVGLISGIMSSSG